MRPKEIVGVRPKDNVGVRPKDNKIGICCLSSKHSELLKELEQKLVGIESG